MSKENKTMKFTALASGALMMTAFGTNNSSASELFGFENLGTGAQLRSNLITANAMNAFISNTDAELECGEGKCGEGKCGGKSDKKTEKKDGVKATAAPAMEKPVQKTEKKEAVDGAKDEGGMKPAQKSGEESNPKLQPPKAD